MTPPKTIYLPDSRGMMEWNEATNEVTNQKFTYHSDTHLKEWIEDENKKLEFAGIIRIDELLKYLNEQ